MRIQLESLAGDLDTMFTPHMAGARNMLRDWPVDLLIVDDVLPDSTFQEILAWGREPNACRQFVLMTDRNVARHDIDAAQVLFFAKPFSMAEFGKLVAGPATTARMPG